MYPDNSGQTARKPGITRFLDQTLSTPRLKICLYDTWHTNIKPRLMMWQDCTDHNPHQGGPSWTSKFALLRHFTVFASWIPAFCPPGYTHFPGYHCYKLLLTAQTWNDSLRLCENEGGSLVSLETPGEHAAMRPWLVEQGMSDITHHHAGGTKYVWLRIR